MGTTRDALFFLRSCMLVLLLFGFATSFASAQTKKVTGKVTELSGAPLPGVTVVVNGTTNGTVTDIDGNYSISNVPENAILVYSFVGMKVQELSATGKTSIDITMQDESIGLQEVVAIGYGTQKKKEITSSIAVVKSDEFNKGNVNSPVQLIQGKVSGLSISKAGGNPNSGFDIRLRGLSTIGANSGPLIVIDGVVGGSLDNVDPNDIESINVLKDGSAAAIYGTRGSSGVILVATKTGKRNTSVVDYNGYVTVESIAKHADVMTATEWRTMQKETKLGTDFGGDTDWFKETTRQAVSKVQNISMSGGSEKTTYRASVNYRDVEGVSLTTGFKQLNGRVNISQKAMNDKLTIDMNLGATKKEAEYGFGEAFKQASIFNPTAPVMSTEPAYAKWNGYFNQTLFDYYNPVQILQENSSKGEDLLYNLSLKGTYKIVNNLTVDASYSRQGNSNQRSEYYSKKSFWVGANKNGSAVKKEDTGSNSLFESTINYNGTVAKDARFSVLGGYSYQDFTYSGFDMSGGNFLTDAFRDNNMSASLDYKNGLGTVGSYKNSEKLIAFFGRVNLNVNDIWFLTASARYEGSSRFGEANKWGIFPAIGGGVEIAKFLNVSAIDNLKIRGNYGITGNRPKDSYLALLRLGPKGNFFYNGNFSPAYAPVSNANSDLKWEKKGEIDLGFDFSLFKSKITGAFDFYTRTTTDLLFSYQVPVPPNLYDQAMLNLGEIKSSGLELAVTFNAIRTKDFSYSTTLTPSYNLENTLVSLSGTYNGDELKYGVRDLGNMGSPGQNGTPLVRAEEGKPIGQILSLVFKEIDSKGNLTFEDLSGPDGVPDGKIDPYDRKVVGNALPKLLIGWGNDFTFKNWDANLFFNGVFGHDLVNSFRSLYEVPNQMGSYNLPKTAKDRRNAAGLLMNNSSGVFSSLYVEKASFVSLDNASIGYNIKLTKGAIVNKIRVYAAGNNLFYITKYKGVDPNPRYGDIEDNNNPLVPGIERRGTYFRTRSVTVGVNIVF